jgi:xanthosine utilization system XapX-like protein
MTCRARYPGCGGNPNHADPNSALFHPAAGPTPTQGPRTPVGRARRLWGPAATLWRSLVTRADSALESARLPGADPDLSSRSHPTLVPTRDAYAVMSPAWRLAAAGLVWATLIVIGIGFSTQASVLREVAVPVFLLLELGIAPVLLAAPMRASRFTLVAVVTSLSATVLIGTVMARTHVWQPAEMMTTVVMVTIVLLATVTVREIMAIGLDRAVRIDTESDASTTAAEEARVGRSTGLPWVPLATVVALVLVVGSSLLVRSDPTPGGLISLEGPGWFVGVAILAAAVVFALVTHRSPALPLLVLSGVVVLSQAIVYGTPTMVSAARHVGVIDSIRVDGGVTLGRDIFQSWAGLFSGVAWVADVAGIQDVMVIATWWPVMITPMIALAATVLARRFLADDGRAWLAGGLFALTLTLNTIYFSPQSLGIVLSLCIAALALGAGRPAGETSFAVTSRPAAPGELAGQGDPAHSARPRASGVVGWWPLAAILVLGSTLAVTHQISPYLTTAALGVFVVFRLVRPWWTPVLVLGPAVLWAVLNRSVLGTFLVPAAAGNVLDNAAPPVHDGATLDKPLVNTLAFGLPAAVLVLVGLAALASFLLHRKSRQQWALVLAAASPASLIIVTNYGAEGIFRVTLFAAPWLCILAVMLPWPRRLGRRLGVAALAAVMAVVVSVNVFGNTALDWNRVASVDTTEATRVFEDEAEFGAALLVPGNGNATPGARTAKYDEVQYVTRDALGGYADTGPGYDAVEDEQDLTEQFALGWEASEYYVIVSDVLGAYDERYGFQTYADYEELGDAFADDDRWDVVYSSPTVVLYRLSDPADVRG